MSFIKKLLNKAAPVDMPAHVIDGSSLSQDADLLLIAKHWLEGGDVDMQMADGSWVYNQFPTFSKGVNYRPSNGSNAHITSNERFIQIGVNRVNTELQSTKSQIRTLQTNLNTSKDDVARFKQGYTEANSSLLTVQSKLRTANATIDGLRAQLNKPTVAAKAPVAPVNQAPQVPVPSIASPFKETSSYASRDGRTFEVVADKFKTFSFMGLTYNPSIDPDGKQLVVVRNQEKKQATFATRTHSGLKKQDAGISNLDLVVGEVTASKTFSVTPRLSTCGDYIIVAKRYKSSHPYIALDKVTGEATPLTAAQTR